ncbi:unnamed protein product [Moneuplotes crassus]|uniref:Uncharacterized protein n=2 Tax=Euplotes crassus TaxID=5936 RepID=A0AAD2D6V8_EUPCR|nr:unnamed protein product [Moneuplotes crassus]
METNQITVIIKYQGLDYYGKHSQVALNIASDLSVLDLKKKIAFKLKIPEKDQIISLKYMNHIIPLKHEEAILNQCGMKNRSIVYVEQTDVHIPSEGFSSDDEQSSSIIHHKADSTKDVSKRFSGLSNPRYFLKLGIEKKRLTSGMEEDDETPLIIDQLIKTIRLDCTPSVFKNEFDQVKKQLRDLNLKQDITIDSKSPNGWTCIHAACQYQNLPLVEYLVDKMRCDPNVLSDDGWSALHIASHLGFHQIVDFLLKTSKVDPNLIGSTERGAGLHCAVNANHFAVVQIYLMNNVDIYIKNADGKTPKDICKDANILSLFEKVEKCQQEGKNNSEQLYSPREEIKEDLEENEDSVDCKKEEKEEDQKIDEEVCEETRQSLILEAQYNKESIYTEEYLDRVIANLDQFKNNQKFCGFISRVGKYFMSSRQRYFELNPINGTFIKYKTVKDYPRKPRQIMNLLDIADISLVTDGWFIKKGCTYFQIADIKGDKQYFFSKSQKLATFWLEELKEAKIFYHWLKNIAFVGTKCRKEFSHKYDKINNGIVNVKLDTRILDERGSLERLFTSSVGSTDHSSNKEKRSPVSSGASIEETKSLLPLKPKVQARECSSPDSRTPIKKLETSTLDEDLDIGYKSFKILDILGQGTFGKVFKVEKIDDGKIYAMKVLKKSVLARNKHLKYAITECNVLKRADHPFIIKLHYSFQTPDYLYMILDYCPNGDLAIHLNNKHIFEEDEARFFIAEMILAMEYLHSKDILYRDLKPENILVYDNGHIKMADFGLAKEGVSDRKKAKSFCGSPAYLAPEMLGTRGVGKAADIYQLGAVLYELLIGLPPYYTENIKKLYENIKVANLQIPNYISPAARSLLKKLLHKDPKQRIGVRNKTDIKNHHFFRGIDWEKLEAGEISPPITLTLQDGDSDIDPFENEYLNSMPQKQIKFIDKDYNDSNKNVNRLKQFTFIKTEKDESDED